tara:strand:- start:150 stop:416 length:267 start_codon:yes stop_codon:yes gene_type:complete
VNFVSTNRKGPVGLNWSCVPARAIGWYSALVCLGAFLLPSIAFACPSCAGGEGGGIAFFVILGSMILLPFGVVATVAVVLHQARLEDQ